MPALPCAGLCTECGVCDDEEEGGSFGKNVVYDPPPIPEFEGYYRPNAVKAQRLRFRWAVAGWGGLPRLLCWHQVAARCDTVSTTVYSVSRCSRQTQSPSHKPPPNHPTTHPPPAPQVCQGRRHGVRWAPRHDAHL